MAQRVVSRNEASLWGIAVKHLAAYRHGLELGKRWRVDDRGKEENQEFQVFLRLSI